jgi:hypothetical protein
MKTLLEYLSINLVSLACVGSAAYLCATDSSGWGWFLVVGAVTASRIKRTTTKINTQ